MGGSASLLISLSNTVQLEPKTLNFVGWGATALGGQCPTCCKSVSAGVSKWRLNVVKPNKILKILVYVLRTRCANVAQTPDAK